MDRVLTLDEQIRHYSQLTERVGDLRRGL